MKKDFLVAYLCQTHVLRWMRARVWFLLALMAGFFWCGSANAQRPVASFFYDTEGRVICQERDTNGDRRVDVWVTYKDVNEVLQEEDQNFNGKIDARYFFKDGRLMGQDQVTEAEPQIPAMPFSSVEEEVSGVASKPLL